MDATRMNFELPYLHEDLDRHGNVRIYFRRRKGAKKVRIRSPLGSPDFLEEYRIAMAASEPAPAMDAAPQAVPEPARPSARPTERPTAIAGSFRWLCQIWFASPEFKKLDPSTQKTRRSKLESCWDEIVAPGETLTFGDVPIPQFNSKAVRVLRDRKADKPEGANGRLKAISPMFTWALEAQIDGVTTNPVRDVKKFQTGSEGWHTWTIEEVQQYEERHPIGTKARLAMALLLYLGQRRSDVPQFGRQHVKKGKLRFTQHKNRNRNAVTLELPIIPELQKIIDASPTGDMTFLVTEYGKPFSIAGFGNKMRTWCDEAGLPHCAAHGLRKAAATRAAELGCTAHEIMSITGHKSLEDVEIYTRAADQKRLAVSAMGKISRINP